MAKTYKQKVEVIPESRQVQNVPVYSCDKCNTRIFDDYNEAVEFGDENLDMQVLEIYLNLDQCVNDRVKMQLCLNCLKPIWNKICEAIGADPEAELRIGEDYD